MKLMNLNSPQDIMALLVRRKWWIVFPFLALSCAALLLTYMLPRMYVSEALVLIQPRDVPNDFVKDLIAGTTAQRLSAIEQNVLSRTNLLQIVREYEDIMPESQNLNIEDKISNLRNQIGVDFSGGQNIGGEKLPVTYFRISYRNRNPEVAQKIAAKVTSVFIDQDLKAREAKVEGTTDFLTTELEKISLLLKESETKKKNLKAIHRNELPEQLATNIAMLNVFVEQRKSNLEARDRLVTELTNVGRDLSATPQTIAKPKIIVPVPQATASVRVLEFLKAQNELSALSAKGLTKNHPDIMTATNRLESTRKELTKGDQEFLDRKDDKPAVVSVVEETVPNQAYLPLVSRKDNLETELKIKQAAVESSDKEIDKYNQRIQNSPQSEQDMADVLRENADLTKQYDDLKSKLSQAQVSQSLETRQQGSQFRNVDPANLPLSPSKPVKSAIAGIGILLSLLAGMGIAAAVDIANQKMWTLSDVEALLGTTVLVEIPEIVTPADIAEGRRRRSIYVASIAALSAAYGAGLYFAYIHQSFVLRHLEPVIKRLY